MDDLTGDPIGTTLGRIPLSQRIYDAIVLRQGPHADSLHMALALGNSDLPTVRRVRERAEMEAEEVNRALLRTLAGFRMGRPMHAPGPVIRVR